MSATPEWVERIEKQTAGSLYEVMVRVADELESGLRDLRTRLGTLAIGETNARQGLRSLERRADALEAGLAELGRKIDAALVSNERIEDVLERLQYLMENVVEQTRAHRDQIAEEILHVLERARTR